MAWRGKAQGGRNDMVSQMGAELTPWLTTPRRDRVGKREDRSSGKCATHRCSGAAQLQPTHSPIDGHHPSLSHIEHVIWSRAFATVRPPVLYMGRVDSGGGRRQERRIDQQAMSLDISSHSAGRLDSEQQAKGAWFQHRDSGTHVQRHQGRLRSFPPNRAQPGYR